MLNNNMYEFFTENKDISKAFDKTGLKGLLYKLKQNGISGKLFDIITDFLNFRKQKVVLNG